MKIGYRRVSGKLPLTANEAGARGTWLEKRRALIAELLDRGHTVDYLSDPTPKSQAAGFLKVPYQACDLLVLEFGGMNLMFNKKAWEETFVVIRAHKGKIVFLCDDPDLTFLWKEMPDEDWSRWTIAANATEISLVRDKLKVPTKARVIDLPFHELLPVQEFSDGDKATTVYYGRPNGRIKILTPYLLSGILTVAGRTEEWNDPSLRIVEPPAQKDRAEWYRQWRGCFAMYDQKHALCGWRTGRAYHALLAGIPVVVPRGNPALAWAWQLDSPRDLATFIKLPTEDRQALHAAQCVGAKADIEKAFQELGL
jgi:hypothetical protein